MTGLGPACMDASGWRTLHWRRGGARDRTLAAGGSASTDVQANEESRDGSAERLAKSAASRPAG